MSTYSFQMYAGVVVIDILNVSQQRSLFRVLQVLMDLVLSEGVMAQVTRLGYCARASSALVGFASRDCVSLKQFAHALVAHLCMYHMLTNVILKELEYGLSVLMQAMLVDELSLGLQTLDKFVRYVSST